jgi:hypothetical protein
LPGRESLFSKTDRQSLLIIRDQLAGPHEYGVQRIEHRLRHKGPIIEVLGRGQSDQEDSGLADGCQVLIQVN